MITTTYLVQFQTVYLKTPTWESFIREAVETAPPAGDCFYSFIRSEIELLMGETFCLKRGNDVIKSKRINPTYHRQTCYLSHTEPEELSQN